MNLRECRGERREDARLPMSSMKEGVEDAGEERHLRCIHVLEDAGKENIEKLDAFTCGLRDGAKTYSSQRGRRCRREKTATFT